MSDRRIHYLLPVFFFVFGWVFYRAGEDVWAAFSLLLVPYGVQAAWRLQHEPKAP